MKSTCTGLGKFASQWQAPLIFVSVFALYFFTRSPGLDEWDSVQFAMGVREFDIWKHQPHPPGYPLYIFLGWLGNQLFNWDPEFSLHLVSCLGGALFVAAWFLIIRFQFSERYAWLIAGTLAITPIVWMTSTKVLTDSLAAGLLSVQLFLALLYQSEGRIRTLAAVSLAGAAALGARPQLIAVAILILVVALYKRRAHPKTWLAGSAFFIGACLLWLAPTWYLQATLRPEISGWLSYPAQLYSQWQWRLTRPDVYIFADGQLTPYYLAEKFVTHILGWFGIGFGLIRSPFTLVVGSILLVCGLIVSITRWQSKDREFWRSHWHWASLHTAIVFCCLPVDQRYYLLIMPLLLVLLLRGFFQMRKPGQFAVFLLPAFLLSISIPIAIENHAEIAPPMSLVRFLQRQYPLEERTEVLLFLSHCTRHVEWYAPEFTVFDHLPFSSLSPERRAKARAIYTDEPHFAVPSGWQLVPVAEFKRSIVIHLKHHNIRLYRVERSTAS